MLDECDFQIFQNLSSSVADSEICDLNLEEKRRKFKDILGSCYADVSRICFYRPCIDSCYKLPNDNQTYQTLFYNRNVKQKCRKIWIVSSSKKKKNQIEKPDMISPTTAINQQKQNQQTEELTFEHLLIHFANELKLVTGERIKKHNYQRQNKKIKSKETCTHMLIETQYRMLEVITKLSLFCFSHSLSRFLFFLFFCSRFLYGTVFCWVWLSQCLCIYH